MYDDMKCFVTYYVKNVINVCIFKYSVHVCIKTHENKYKKKGKNRSQADNKIYIVVIFYIKRKTNVPVVIYLNL